jgi:hypothetical protein
MSFHSKILDKCILFIFVGHFLVNTVAKEEYIFLLEFGLSQLASLQFLYSEGWNPQPPCLCLP